MATIKVAKFGGSSLCDGQRFNKVMDIVTSDPTRRIIIPSAPGKRSANDTKVTDLLLQVFEGHDVFEQIKHRYDNIIEDLNLQLDLSPQFNAIEKAIRKGATIDYVASRGEYLNAIILAEYLGFEFIDAADVIKFDEDEQLMYSETLQLIQQRTQDRNCVIPGFYGSDILGKIITFSRGGSDVTGALCAAAVGATVYENWTDVSGFFMADPRVVEDAINIAEVSYKELRELSYMGAGVLHEDAIFPVRDKGIPVNIKNTNAPDDDGTMILPHDQLHAFARPVTGIAGKKGFAVITVEKARMNSEIGFARRILSVLEDYNISIEHMPTGIDTLSIVLSDNTIADFVDELKDRIIQKTHPDTIEITYDMALIATVGHGMVHHPGTASKIFTALSDAGINIRMIDQGSSELNIIIGVENDDYEHAICAIYRAFCEDCMQVEC